MAAGAYPRVMSVLWARVRAMRLLHTSDWHLGRSLHRADLRAAQAAFLDHLVDVARAEKVDAVLVAGDVYDRAVPPVDAVELCEDALLRLHDTGARIVLISGNHDSARRLGFGSGLLEKAGVHVRTRPGALARPVIVEDAHGPVAVYGVPYLEPDAVRGELPPGQDEIPRGHAGVLGHAVACVRADAEARGIRRRVVMAHGWVSGGAASESERDISVGGVGQVPAELFAGFGYVALGHLHGQQTVAPQMRYSGSPLPYSFSEASHRKGSWLVDLDDAGTAHVEQVPAPVCRRLSVLRGRLADLLGSAAYGRYEDDFVSVTLTDPSRPEGAMDALRARFPHVLVLAFEPEGVLPDQRGYRARTAGRDDLAIAAEFVRHVSNASPTAAEEHLLASAFAAVRTEEAAG
jgi:DNA repair protein SbcD/Mre11